MYAYITNPINNKKVKINEEEGKQMLINYLSILNGGAEEKLRQGPETLCCLNQTKIVKSHGVIPSGSFILPKGASFITITTLGNFVPLSEELDEEIYQFYKAGYSIFKDNDLSNEKSDNGKILEVNLKKKFGDLIEFRNHVGDGKTRFNNMILVFIDGCYNYKMCSIWCLDTGYDCPLYSYIANKPVNMISLKNLINKEVYDKYILIACRNFAEDIPDVEKQLSRQRSAQN